MPWVVFDRKAVLGVYVLRPVKVGVLHIDAGEHIALFVECHLDGHRPVGCALEGNGDRLADLVISHGQNIA
jgi:hypothetical protein